MGALLSLINPISTILDKVLPDKSANDAAKAHLVELQVSGELQQTLAQLQVDQTEAASQSVFVSGWRPFVGWCCGAAFCYSYILQPLLQTLLVMFHSTFDPAKLPRIDLSEMMPVLLGMLGLAAARTFEKVQGANPGH